MSFVKLLDDFVRYDFYYNCSAVMTYFNLTPITPALKLFEKYVPRVHESRYDLVQIFNETFKFKISDGTTKHTVNSKTLKLRIVKF